MSKKEYEPRICKICGEEFTPNIYNQIYCCKECYKKAMNDRRRGATQYKKCPICGEIFQLKTHNQIYCSDKCKKLSYNKGKDNKKPIYKECPVCREKLLLTTYNKIYCSVKCRQKDKWKIKEKICEQCGKKFITNNYNKKYCCERCRKDATNERYKTGFKKKKCARCGEEYQPHSSKSKYCDNCRSIALKENKRESNRKYERNKKRNDINYKIISWCRYQIYRCLQYNSNTNRKDEHTFDILNYNVEQFRQRIEFQFKNGMSWENRGKLWEIHHKKELSKFVFILPNGEIDYKQIRIANSLSNLQSLTKDEHKLLTINYNKNKKIIS